MNLRTRAALAITVILFVPLANAQISQLAELTASDGTPGQEFGYSIAMASDTVVVGAPSGALFGPARAYVFTGAGSNWTQVAELADGGTDDLFGSSVAVGAGGAIIVAGAPQYGPTMQQGAVYVFAEPTGGWRNIAPTAQLTVSNGQFALGDSVAISADGKTILAGATGLGGPGSGAVYVFVEPLGGWASTSHPTAVLSAPATWDLGNAVAISPNGDTTVAGSFGFDQDGGVFVFVKPKTGWQDMEPSATLSQSDPTNQDAFGFAVATIGNTIVAGSPPHSSSGTVYIFVEPESGWGDMTQTAELTIPTTVLAGLGASVAVENGAVLAGAPGAYIGKKRTGIVVGYTEPAGGWVNSAAPRFSATSSDGGATDEFGASVALNGTTIVVGAPGHSIGANTEQGAAYVFGPRR